MTTPTPHETGQRTLGVTAIHRGQLIAVCVIGLVLGIIGLVLPGAGVVAIAVLFGIYLVAAGIFRINSALLAPGLGAGMRWLFGLLGVLVVVAGIVCLADPFESITVLAFVIGLGWIFEGIVDVVGGIQGSIRPAWLGIVSGVISVLAGIVTFVLPAVAISTFVVIGSILLIVVAVSTLMTMPRRPKA